MQILAPYGRYDAPFAVKFGTEKHTTFLGAPVPTPFFTDEGQIWFGVLEQTQGLHLQAEFQNHNFGQILTFCGAPGTCNFGVVAL